MISLRAQRDVFADTCRMNETERHATFAGLGATFAAIHAIQQDLQRTLTEA